MSSPPANASRLPPMCRNTYANITKPDTASTDLASIGTAYGAETGLRFFFEEGDLIARHCRLRRRRGLARA